jgi:hypothetical protein
VSSGTLNADLHVPTTSNQYNSSQARWSGSGSYYVLIIPPDGNSIYTTNGYVYMDGGDSPVTYTIDSAASTLSFDKFKKRNIGLIPTGTGG